MNQSKKHGEPLDNETRKRLKSLERGRLISDISIFLLSLIVLRHLI